MDTNFCSNYDIPKRIFKVCSVSAKTVFVFMDIYFIESIFKKDDRVTWLVNGERLYGTVISINTQNNKIKIKPDLTKKIVFKMPDNLNKVHPFDETISKIYDNISKKSKDKFKNISEEEKNLLQKFIAEKDILKELFPRLKEGYDHKFIYNDMIYLDDTSDTLLKKISQLCSIHGFEDHKYIYASYINKEGEVTPVGFKYKDSKMMSPNEIITKQLCDIFDIENDEDSFNIIENSYENILEEYDIKNDMIYFINLEDFIDKHELNTIDFKKCSEGEHEVSSFKKRIINKYWPQLKNEKMSNITGEDAKKNKQDDYKKESEKLEIYSSGNQIIHGNIDPSPGGQCGDEIYINFFKTTKKQPKNITVDLYKLFTDFPLREDVPFKKWVSNNNGNKYYKLFKDSIVYDGYGDFEMKDKFVDFKTCQEWIKDFYRSKKRSLEKINRFEIIHKDDILSFKVFSKEGTYATLAIHIDGTIEFIIKKDSGNKGVSSKGQIIKLINLSNDLIKRMNEANKYSETKIVDLGNTQEIEDIFLKNNIDFIDAKISYRKGEYEVKEGHQNGDDKENDELLPPFVIGETTNLFIPILRKVCKNLSMFFRYMNEDDHENKPANIIGLQYNRQSNFSNITTISSLIKVYLDKETYPEGLEAGGSINDIYRVFNVNKETIKDEIKSAKELAGDRENYRKETVVDENTPDITISVSSNFVDFEIRNMKSFMEFQRITSLTKAIMVMFGKYVNNQLQDGYTSSIFNTEGHKLNIKNQIIVEEEEEPQGNANDFLDQMSTDSESSYEESSSGGGVTTGSLEQKGGAQLRSYYLKRLKENDKKLFQPDKPWVVKQKNGTQYGYAKQCADNLDRKPISVTTEGLERINSGDYRDEDGEDISGKDSYSYDITVPRRSDDIKYICPQYWDVSKEISLTKSYVDKHRKDVIKNKENKENNTILERKGKYWDAVSSHEDLLPNYPSQILHPEGYKLPCCFSKKALAKENGEIAKEKKEKTPVKRGRRVSIPLCKINTKESLPISIGTCSQLPMKLKILLSQDKIFEYDPNLSVSNGFVRKGVEQSESNFIFKQSSFINSYIELIDYDGDSEKYINEELIEKLLDDIKYYQFCPTLHKYFRKGNVTQEDKDDIIQNYLEKGNISKTFVEEFGEDNITTLIKILNKDDISIDSNEIGYIYSLVLSLKTYIDFLRSHEEKKDEYIIPAINSISSDKKNIIIFEKDDEQVKTKMTEHTNSDKYCFIIKEGHYYEPIVYRVILVKEQVEVKILSTNTFSTFDIFKKDIFINLLDTPYPRGRKKELKSGITEKGIDQLKCKDNVKYCSEWILYKEINKVKKGSAIRWINNPTDGCPNSGVKNYDKFIEEVDGIIFTEAKHEITSDNIYVKTTKQVDPQLKKGLQDKNKWLWIDRDCDNIHDKDIESLIRKKEDSQGDKLLLDYSTKTKKTKNDKDSDILKAMESNFFIVNRLLKDLEKLKDNNKIQYHYENGGDVEHYVNNYSEITHIVYKNASETGGDILLPTIGGPIKMNPQYKGITPIYDINIKSYPEFKDVQNYIAPLNLKIERIVINSKDKITCLFLESGGIIPIKPENTNEQIKREYDILTTEINPFEIDKHIMGKKDMTKLTQSDLELPENYIIKFKKENDQKNTLFTKILNLIKNDEIIEGVIMSYIQSPVSIRKHKVEKIVEELEKKVITKIDIPQILASKVSKVLQEFAFKLIISVENGDKISTINKIVDTVVKYSDLEKNTPNTEVFIKYVRDKDIMDSHLRDIFIKKSDFINIRQGRLFSDNHRIKTTKLKTTPYYINKLFGPHTSIVFNIDGNGGDWFNLSLALQAIGIKPSYYANQIKEIKGIVGSKNREIKHIGHIRRMILHKLSELNDKNKEDKKSAFIRSYNKYNLLRYGDKHTMFNTVEDIMKYWRDSREIPDRQRRINKPDIELILERINEEKIEDYGVLLISFSKGKEMDIKFYGTDNITLNTKVAILHHTLYNGDYILSNIHVGENAPGEGMLKYLTVEKLYEISDLHKKWIKVYHNKEDRITELNEREEKLEDMIDQADEHKEGLKVKLRVTREEKQGLEEENQ